MSVLASVSIGSVLHISFPRFCKTKENRPFNIYGHRNQCKVQNIHPSLFEHHREVSLKGRLDGMT